MNLFSCAYMGDMAEEWSCMARIAEVLLHSFHHHLHVEETLSDKALPTPSPCKGGAPSCGNPPLTYLWQHTPGTGTRRRRGSYGLGYGYLCLSSLVNNLSFQNNSFLLITSCFFFKTF